MNLKHCVRIAAGLLAGGVMALAAAQDFPSRPVKMVITFPPGGASDVMGRLIANKMGVEWKQPVVVENRPGAAGSIGTTYVAGAPADGYVYMIGNMGSTVVAPLLTKVPYDLGKDFQSVSLIATGPVVVAVNSKSTYKSLEDLIAKARTQPVNFGSGGSGTLAHLVGEMINSAAKVKMQHIPYKGGVLALNDLLAGNVDMVAADPQAVIPHLQAGTLRALAVTSEKRFSTLPDVPSFAEKGMGNITALNSWGVYLPAATPKPVIDRYKAVLKKVMADPEVVRRFNELGVEALFSTSDELLAFNAKETAKFGRIIKEQGIQAD